MERLGKQAGLTMGAVIFLLFVVVMGVLFGFRLVPVYIEHYSVVSSLESLQADPALHPQGLTTSLPLATQTLLMKRLAVNNITNVGLSNIKLMPSGRGLVVQVSYEVRVPFVGNIDLLVHFDDRVNVGGR